MLRTAAAKIAWVGRTASMVFGLALVMALVLGLAATAWSATGGTFILGKANTATTPTSLVSTLADAAKSSLVVQNKSGGAALDLRVGNITTPANNVAPMKVNSSARVANLNAASAGRADSAANADSATNAQNADNADTLDNKDSSEFLGRFEKATDTYQLDGKNSFAYMSSNTYRAEDPPNEGLLRGDGTTVISKSCQAGDRLLSGGPANIENGSILLESFPASTTTWTARIDPYLYPLGGRDAFSVVVLCANQ